MLSHGFKYRDILELTILNQIVVHLIYWQLPNRVEKKPDEITRSIGLKHSFLRSTWRLAIASGWHHRVLAPTVHFQLA